MFQARVGLCNRAGLAGLALALLLCVFTSQAYAQDDYYPKLQKAAIDEANAGQYASSLEKAYEVYGAFPGEIYAHIIVAFDLINLGRHKEANGYINSAFAIDATNFSTYFNAAYYYAIEGDVPKAKQYLTESIKLYRETYNLKEILDEIRKVGSNMNKAVVFNQLADWYEQQLKVVKEKYPSLQDAFDEASKDPSKIRQVADSYAAKYTALKWPEMAVAVYGYACVWLRELGRPSEAVDAGEAGFNYLVKNGYGQNPYLASQMLYQLLNTYSYLGNDEKVVDYADEVVSLSDKLPLHVYDVRALILASSAYGRLNKKTEERNLARLAYKLAEKSVNRFDAVQAANRLCGAYNYKIDDTDVNDAIYYGEQALQLGMKYHFEDLLGSIEGNLGLAYYKLGTYEAQSKTIRMYGSLIAIYKQKEMWDDASLALNNVGAMMFNGKGYKEAAEYFEESIALAEKGMTTMSARDKLTFYQSQISAYQFLTACYAYLDNPQKVYEAIEGSRSRVLTERLAKGKDVKAGSLTDLQNLLQADEAAIYYSLFSGQQVIILVVTKKYSKVVVHTDDTFIGNIKDKYLERLAKEHGERRGQEDAVDRETRVAMADFTKVTELTRKFFEKPGIADDILKEYLQGYYRFLILPVLNRLGGVKNLLISPDDVLNYIPFEALTMHDGKYLIEKYGVRYLNSTGALRLIQERQYPNGRKPLIAMGGAIYEPNLAVAPQIQTQHDLNALTTEVAENIGKGTSQRRAYAALFGNQAMNPLPGTLDEVKSISKSVPSADVFSGRDFTENRLKAMSKSGALKQYKVLHLATHGFVVEEIPDLSGVAMSVFSNEEGGEDGFLNVNEIASLDLNADLTVLSACQTALGKIYSGEGVTGLTQSLLVAGSNAALVSLWPVNDTSTSLFMSDLYKEAQKGKPYWQIVSELKRKFIKGDYGDEFKHPNFWAPFVYFGR
ncbi:MAG: CHAT domain-containing tetratricopeptide repeat protein [Bacteroidota bacterium]